MALNFLQANINHCAGAQHLFVQSLAQWSIHVAVVAEPYKIPPRDDWAGDLDGSVAVITQGAAGSPPFEKVAKGAGCVAVLLGGVWVVGVYFSPNRSQAEFESFLARLGALVAQGSQPRPVLVAGDFNAKSLTWGSSVTDARGEALEEWAISIGLVVLNRGSEDTCVRHNGGSVVDVTFATPALARRVQGWRVLVDEETLSDHRYIRYSVSASQAPTQPGGGPTARFRGGKRWAANRLDAEAAREAAIVQAWLPVPDGPVRVEEEAEWFGVAMSQVCDAAMPRVTRLPVKRQVYWWSAELSELRAACMASRRRLARHRRRRTRRPDDDEQERLLLGLHREARRALRVAIVRAKAAADDESRRTLDRDPWGRPYKVALRKLRPWAPPLTQSLRADLVEEVVAALFPATEDSTPPPMAPRPPAPSSLVSARDIPEVSPQELEAAVLRLRSKNSAPGLDGVPGRVWVLAVESLGTRLRGLFSACLQQGIFPSRWKTGKLVLLRKEGRPVESPSAYRPIVLLDEVCKLFERVVHARLVEHLEGTGPDLADCQFGFRRGRSTIHAILRVKAQAEDAVSRGRVVVAVSLDIANAFNTMPWACIEEALRYHEVPPYLRRLVHAYLSNRYVVYPGADGWHRRAVSRGVPQGSVLGPLLWNIGYDWVLRGTNLRGVAVVCYADDTLVTATARTFQRSALLASFGTELVVGRIRRLGLTVALNKTEAVCFHGPRCGPPPGAHITVEGVRIPVGSRMRYLGLILDSRWDFRAHFEELSPKLVRAAGALGRLLPNTDGPGIPCRNLYAGVVRSMALYGCPVWASSLGGRCVRLLHRPQRMVAQRIIRGYRTVSHEAACVLAGTLPWELDAKSLSSVFFWREEASRRGQRLAPREVEAMKASLRRAAVEEWRSRLENPSAGVRTVAAVRPVLEQWMDRRHGAPTFRLTQVLTGHGCFGAYLCRIAGAEESAVCHHCGSCREDTAQHTLEECPAWDEERSALVAVVGRDLSLPAVVAAMVGSRRSWRAMLSFCESAISQKESAERDREQTDPARRHRRRRGRRDNT